MTRPAAPSEPSRPWWTERRKRLPVADGLRARSRTGAIGKSWWSKRFLDVLSSFAIDSRLARGRNYARAGQVASLAVRPGEVTAAVQGTRPAPYAVRIGLAPFPDAVWSTVEVALAAEAIHSARLLAGEMPPDIEEVCARAGAPLFPRRFTDLVLRCSCPDHAVPCKHVAATFYLLAEAFDEDPFQILHWRGRDRDAMLARLRALRDAGAAAGPHPPPAPAGVAGPPVGAAVALAELGEPSLAEALDQLSPDRFWLPPVPLPDRPPAALATDPDLLLRQLPPPGPGLGGAALVDALRPAYQRFSPSVSPTVPGAQ